MAVWIARHCTYMINFTNLVAKMLKKGTLKKEFPHFGHLLLKHYSIAADFTCRGLLFPSTIRGKRGPAVLTYTLKRRRNFLTAYYSRSSLPADC